MKLSVRNRQILLMMAFDPNSWDGCSAFGSWDASWHSGALRRLWQMGLAERRRKKAAQWEYRITAKGIAVARDIKTTESKNQAGA